MSAHVAGELARWPSRDELAAILRAAGFELGLGRFSLRILDFPHFVFAELGGDRGTPAIEADADDADTLLEQVRRVSRALARAGICHRFEIYDAEDRLAGYVHHAWPPPSGSGGVIHVPLSVGNPVPSLELRPETPADSDAIALVLGRAFLGHPHSDGTEAALVEALRSAGALTVAMVAVADGTIRGYAAASPVCIGGHAGRWHGLGPVAVDPVWQGRGLGTALVRACLDRLRERGSEGCVVLGDPAYYGRFGFRAGLGPTYPGAPEGAFQSLTFTGAIPHGETRYHPAFGS